MGSGELRSSTGPLAPPASPGWRGKIYSGSVEKKKEKAACNIWRRVASRHGWR